MIALFPITEKLLDRIETKCVKAQVCEEHEYCEYPDGSVNCRICGHVPELQVVGAK